jgi:hypothetical protein
VFSALLDWEIRSIVQAVCLLSQMYAVSSYSVLSCDVWCLCILILVSVIQCYIVNSHGVSFSIGFELGCCICACGAIQPMHGLLFCESNWQSTLNICVNFRLRQYCNLIILNIVKIDQLLIQKENRQCSDIKVHLLFKCLCKAHNFKIY